MSETQIICRDIDLKDSVLSGRERGEIHDLVQKYREAFSCYGELGACPNFEVNIQLNDGRPKIDEIISEIPGSR